MKDIHSESVKDSDSELGDSDKFQAILQLIMLLNAILPESKESYNAIVPNTAPNTSLKDTRKTFDYLDAITNLMVRDAEVVAAVACGKPLAIPTRGLFLVESAPTDIQESLSDIDDDSIDVNGYSRVATVANSTLERVESSSSSNTLWQTAKEKDLNAVFLWCDFDSLDLDLILF